MQDSVRPDMDEERLQAALLFLDEVREMGYVNMFGAAPEVQQWWEDEYGEEMDKYRAREILVYWMKTFAQRHGKE